MTDLTTAEEGAKEPGVELLEKFSKLTMEDAIRAAVRSELSFRATEVRLKAAESRAASAEVEIEMLKTLVADYEEAMADKRRLARMIDVAMHGEEGAALQPSLCDLVGPASALRDRVAALEGALKKIRDNAEYGRETYSQDRSETGRSLSRCWGIVRDYADAVLTGGPHE
jgi:hypothetical protein